MPFSMVITVKSREFLSRREERQENGVKNLKGSEAMPNVPRTLVKLKEVWCE